MVKELERLVGQKASYQARFPVGEASIAYFAQAIGDDSPVYVDAGAAIATGRSGLVAPPTFVCETAMYSDRSPDSNGYIGHGWDFLTEGWQRVRGGNAYTFHRELVPTDVLSVEWEVASARETQGSRDATLVIVESHVSYRNQDRELLAENVETMIYRRIG